MAKLLRWVVQTLTFTASCGLACARFGAEDPAPSVDGGADGPYTAAEAASDARDVPDGIPPMGVDASGPSICSGPTAWDLCEDFESAALPSQWSVQPAGPSAIALSVSSARASTGRQSLEVAAPNPTVGADKHLEATPAGTEDAAGIRCALDLNVAEAPGGWTRVLWLRFATAPASALAFGQVSVWVRGDAAYADASWVFQEGGSGQSATSLLSITPNTWRHVELTVDWTQGISLDVGGLSVVAPIVDFKPLTRTAVRVGATTNPPVGPTKLYVDAVACRRLP